MSDSSPMMQQYEAIKNQHRDALLFFRLGDFYEMFRSDAVEASRILSLTLTQRHGVPMCGVPYHARQNYIQRLLAAGRKVAICEQVGVPGKGKGIVERKVSQVISPGTVIDEAFLNGHEQNYLLSLSLPENGRLGLAFLDISTGELGTRVLDLVQGREVLLAELASRNPREVLVQESLIRDQAAIAQVFQNRPDLVINRFPDWHYDIGATHASLCELFGTISLRSFGLDDRDPHLHPVAALLEYARDAARHSLDHLRSIRIVDQSATMALDEACIRNLELVRNLRDGSKALSLLWVMDQTRTPMGQRLLRQWLLEPSRNRAVVEDRLDATERLYRDQDLLARLRQHLGQLHDLERLAARLCLDRAGPKDLAALGVSLRETLALAEACAPAGMDFNPAPDDLAAAREASTAIAAFLVDEPPYHAADGDFVRGGYHERLDALRSMARDSQAVLAEYLEEERATHGLSGLKLGQNRIIGYYLELSRSASAQVPGHFLRKHSTVGAERFTTSRLMELEDAISHAGDEARRLELELFADFCRSLNAHGPVYARLAQACARLDVLCSFAWSAASRGYVRPRLYDDRRLQIVQGRHPVVEACSDPGSYIPNDIALAPDQVGGTATILLTGPNMAGKSTYLRQTALIALMAHAGSFVPAESAEIGMIDRIFCRVGSSDNLAGGESTFLVEMHETAAILRHASERSLIIMDEVGRGTSTRDGLSIAWAVLEHMLDHLGCRTLFATHFHELTTVQHPALANHSLQVHDDGQQVVFLKRVVPGPASNSYGIHVARLAGVPESVNRRAEAVLAWLQEGPAGAVEVRVSEARPASPPPAPAAAKPAPVQAGGLFAPAEELELMVRSFPLDSSTPLEALTAIARWQESLGMAGSKIPEQRKRR